MEWLHNFHFIRPAFLLILVPALVAVYLFRQQRQSEGHWQQVIDPQLLPFLLDSQREEKTQRSTPLTLIMLLSAFISAIALAGPTWKKLPQPVAKNQDALIILLDMSLSMGAQDLSPSRYVRAVQKVTDIVRSRKDGQTALLVYAGDAYTVTPLTDDTETIENLLPSLSPFIMPSPGSRPDKAIELAQQLATSAGISHAQLLLITDGIQDKDIKRISDSLNPALSQLKVIALGTAEGAPVPMPGSGFLKDGSGNIVMPGLDTGPFQKLSADLNIPWQSMTFDDSDWQTLLNNNAEFDNNVTTTDNRQRSFDLWADQGYWLIILLLPLALLLFRRGVLVSIFLLPLFWPHESYALEWKDLWQTKDQQAAELMQNDPKAAAETFENNDWKGSAAYKAGDYEAAAKAFAEGEQDATGHYNRGNALANSGNLEGATEEYQKALEIDPDLEAAKKNLSTVKKILQQQQQNKQQQNGQNQDNQNNQQQDGQQNQNDQQQSQDSQKQKGQQGQDSQQQGSQNQNGQQNNSQQQPGDPSEQQNAKNDGKQDKDKNAEDKDQQASAAEKQAGKDGKEDDKNKSTASKKDEDDKSSDDKAPSASDEPDDGLSREERAAMQQWLNRVPDQPGNLLQRKFLYQYRQKDNQESGDVLW